MSGSPTRAWASRTRRFIPEERSSKRASGSRPMRETTACTRWSDAGRGMVVVVQSLGHLVGDRAASAPGDLLGQPGDAQPLLADDLALVGLELAADQPQQRALALAVAAQQADPLARLDLQLDLIQQPRTAEGQADVSQAQQCHECCSISCVIAGMMDDADSARAIPPR